MLSVSILGFKEQLDRVQEMNNTSADYVHLDIMDGIFVPDSFFLDEKVVSSIRKPLDVHLMVKDPTNYIGYYSKYNPKYITIHAEIPNAILYLESIRNKKIGAGVAISPKTDLNLLEQYLPYVDLVLVMSVEPGYGGQEFMRSSLNRISRVKDMCSKVNPNIIIEVDGGLNKKNILSCKQSGASMFVVGSYITSSNSFEEVIDQLKKVIN